MKCQSMLSERIPKRSRLPARKTTSQLYKGALGRMEQIIATLESCFVTEGWNERWQSGGVMPTLAADVMTYFRARADGAQENAAKEAKVNDFVAQFGQSLDWIFDGDPRGLICKAAGHSPQAASLQSTSRPLLANAYSNLEGEVTDLTRMAHLAEIQVNKAVGQLSCKDRNYIEVPNPSYS